MYSSKRGHLSLKAVEHFSVELKKCLRRLACIDFFFTCFFALLIQFVWRLIDKKRFRSAYSPHCGWWFCAMNVKSFFLSRFNSPNSNSQTFGAQFPTFCAHTKRSMSGYASENGVLYHCSCWVFHGTQFTLNRVSLWFNPGVGTFRKIGWR